MRFTAVFTAITLASVAAAAAEATCENPKVAATTTAGEGGIVTVEALECDNIKELSAAHEAIRFARRQAAADVCGNQCNTNCFPGQVGTGPNPSDCAVIADALLYDSQNIGNFFVTNPANGTAVLSLQYSTCKALFFNQASSALEYCRTDFSTLTNYLATNCQAQQNAHGGNCVASDGRWFVQVQHI